MFNLMNLLAVTVDEQKPYISPEELAREAQELQSKKIWLAILIILLAAEIFFAVVYPKIKAKRKEKSMQNAERRRLSKKKK